MKVNESNKDFEGVDENMELGQEDKEELMKFETVQTSKDIEFDKIKLSDVKPRQFNML